ncbi:MAG TPA: UDP-N-acetylglucosamine 2-epimerase (non-hydrolyzing) [Longimicrobium sp.]|jgi:UDP-N-acetylglucosamine 2-epimerase (non-hydrolysing)|uniref:non-hydrolyzing UDP-N-acetylglucosamine 2-epimerase n=1 Tax=Longimicrobium sp. TaxID=2029185 RepID=UPI002ED7AEE9
MRILHVVGARPNFMKIAPLMSALDGAPGVEQVLVHTGQHYDARMSDAFFHDLGIRAPDVNLEVGSGTHAVQTARVMLAFEPVLERTAPDLVVVVGDVNSTVACALVAAKRNVAVAHVEAGLRSRDRTMPEELNRLVTDQLAELLLTPSRDADANLRAEGIPEERIHFVGNVMIDTLLRQRDAARALGMPARLGVEPGGYLLVTLHRPGNVDDPATLGGIFAALSQLATERPVLFPIHPRTRARAAEHGLLDGLGGVRLLEPLGYPEMLGLMERAALVLTDSGGLQEETTALGVPCLTLRDSTERPVTVDEGTNLLVPDRSAPRILAAVAAAGARRGRVPELWDGRAGERCAGVFLRWHAERGVPAGAA